LHKVPTASKACGGVRTLNRRNSPRLRPKGRAGGRAGGSGYDFQDAYIGYQLAKLLVGNDRDQVIEVLWEKKSFDPGAEQSVEAVHVDDTILRFASGKTAYVQVKEVSPPGGWSAAQLHRNSVAEQLWRQWSSKQPADRPRTILRLACRGDVTTLELMADAARCSRSPREMMSDETSTEIANEISALAAVLKLSPHSDELLAFLKCFEAEPVNSESDLETRIIHTLAWFGEDAPDLANRLVRMVGRSKHVGPDARSSFTKDTLITALLDDGFSRQRLIAADVLRAGPVDDIIWERYRELVIRKFRSFRVYGLQVDRAVYADLPALFVPLKLTELPAGQPREPHENKRSARSAPSLAERLSAEGGREERDEVEGRYGGRPSPHRDRFLDLAAVLAQKSRFAIIGGPGVGKTTTLKWLAITSTLPGEEGRRLRLEFGLPSDPLIPIYVRFRQFAERIRARGLAGVEGRAGLVADFLKAEFEAELADQLAIADKALPMAQHLLASDKSLFLFDGLDEVADEAMRTRLFESVSDLMEKYPAPRVIVTSRPYAFRRDRAPLNLSLFEPLPLDREARRTFAQQWYRAVRTSGAAPLQEPDARARADDLARAADALPDLAEVPLLLSILALVHFNRQGLPVERATLYDHATLAMLGHWERDPAGRDLGDDAVPPDWVRRLQLNEKEIRRAVEHLAQSVQVHGGGGEFSRAEAIANLAEGLRAVPGSGATGLPARAELLLELLVNRAGLVQERSPDVFAFVHLSFQEYLTARAFVGRGEAGIRELAGLALEERQGEVCRLAVAILSADQRTEADDRATAFINSVGTRSPALAAACLLEAPGVRLEASFAERLARAAFGECTDQRRHYYPPHVTARLVWAALKYTPAADRVLLEILSDSDNGFEKERFLPHRRHRRFDDRHFREFWRHEMRMTPALSVVAARPPGSLAPELAWVCRRLAATDRDQGGRIFRNVAELILIESGEAQGHDHIPALIELLAEAEREREGAGLAESVVARAASVLEKLWQGETAHKEVRDLLTNSLSLEMEHPDGYASDLAWAAAKFLIEHGELSVPGLAKVVVTVGLERRSRHPAASILLKALATHPTLGPATISMLRNGSLNADADVRAGCFGVLTDLGLISGAEGSVDDEQGLSTKLLADPATAQEALATLAENIWSESHPTAWQAVKSLIDAGHTAVHGIPHALVHSGFVSAHAEAMQYVRRLHSDAALSMPVRGALLGGLSSTNAPVATSSALMLAEINATGDAPLIGRIVLGLLRNPDQIGESLPHLRRLVQDEQTKRKGLEIVAEKLGEKPDRRVASAVARMLAHQGLLHVRNLPEALVQFGLHRASDHKEVAEHLRRMLDDPEVATATRRALFKGLSSDDGDTDIGCAAILWEAGSRTHPKIAEALADSGLRMDEQRDQARAWLLELFARPKTAAAARQALERAASRVVNVPRGHARNSEHAWAIADCLLAAKAYHAEELAKALVIGGFHRREDHARRLPMIKESIAENAELAIAIEERLWEALTDHDADVQWGAVCALVDNGFVEPVLAHSIQSDDEDGGYQRDRGEDERVEKLSRLWRVLIREAAREPLAVTTLSSLPHQVSKSALERRALRKLLDDDNPEAACAAAYRLLNDPDDNFHAAALALIKHGLADRQRQPEASRRLDELSRETVARPVIIDALHRALWSESVDAAWAAANYLLERGHAPNSGIFRALVIGGLLSRHPREAEARLRNFLSDPGLRNAVIDALSVGMYPDEDEDVVSLPARLLVEARAPLSDRVMKALNDMVSWEPWVPLALSAMTGRQEEIREAADRLGLAPLADALGSAA
jgi:hypothetical protein